MCCARWVSWSRRVRGMPFSQPRKRFQRRASYRWRMAGSCIYSTDSFAMFELQGVDAQRVQAFLVSALMSDELQEKFNLAKGFNPGPAGREAGRL